MTRTQIIVCVLLGVIVVVLFILYIGTDSVTIAPNSEIVIIPHASHTINNTYEYSSQTFWTVTTNGWIINPKYEIYAKIFPMAKIPTIFVSWIVVPG